MNRNLFRFCAFSLLSFCMVGDNLFADVPSRGEDPFKKDSPLEFQLRDRPAVPVSPAPDVGFAIKEIEKAAAKKKEEEFKKRFQWKQDLQEQLNIVKKGLEDAQKKVDRTEFVSKFWPFGAKTKIGEAKQLLDKQKQALVDTQRKVYEDFVQREAQKRKELSKAVPVIQSVLDKKEISPADIEEIKKISPATMVLMVLNVSARDCLKLFDIIKKANISDADANAVKNVLVGKPPEGDFSDSDLTQLRFYALNEAKSNFDTLLQLPKEGELALDVKKRLKEATESYLTNFADTWDKLKDPLQSKKVMEDYLFVVKNNPEEVKQFGESFLGKKSVALYKARKNITKTVESLKRNSASYRPTKKRITELEKKNAALQKKINATEAFAKNKAEIEKLNQSYEVQAQRKYEADLKSYKAEQESLSSQLKNLRVVLQPIAAGRIKIIDADLVSDRGKSISNDAEIKKLKEDLKKKPYDEKLKNELNKKLKIREQLNEKYCGKVPMNPKELKALKLRLKI